MDRNSRIDAGVAAADRIVALLAGDSDEDHRTVLDSLEPRALSQVVERLREYVGRDPSSSAEPRIHLLQERAILVVGDALWRLRKRHALPEPPEKRAIIADLSASERTRKDIQRVLEGDGWITGNDEIADEGGYLSFINQFMGAVNEREMLDFRASRDVLLRCTPRVRSRDLRIRDARACFRARVPMRVGISSANASDNWTFSKLKGGRVVNFALDLAPEVGAAPAPPILVTLRTIDAPVVELATFSRLATDRATFVRVSETNAKDFFSVPPGEEPTAERSFVDVRDPLLLLKYALVFSGVVGFKEDPEGYVACPARVVADALRFSGDGRGLRLVVHGRGPSRSGFASSSSVTVGLLSVLYDASAQSGLAQPETLSSMALLLENEVGLKSGKQDTDGPILPGIKSIEYPPTTGFLESRVTQLACDEGELVDNLALVNSGIERPPALGLKRGLNMRHYSYVSRDPERFPAVMESLAVHARIVNALTRGDWRRLGELFDEYLLLREKIDPGATQSVHDQAAGRRVLRMPFEELARRGLIHGGMYAGAMGGGCMMLVAAPKGKESVAGADGRERRRLDIALEELRHREIEGVHPFTGLEIYRYGVNADGLVREIVSKPSDVRE